MYDYVAEQIVCDWVAHCQKHKQFQVGDRIAFMSMTKNGFNFQLSRYLFLAQLNLNVSFYPSEHFQTIRPCSLSHTLEID